MPRLHELGHIVVTCDDGMLRKHTKVIDQMVRQHELEAYETPKLAWRWHGEEVFLLQYELG